MSWNYILNQCFPPTACMLCALQMPQTEANYIFREKKKDRGEQSVGRRHENDKQTEQPT